MDFLSTTEKVPSLVREKMVDFDSVGTLCPRIMVQWKMGSIFVSFPLG